MRTAYNARGRVEWKATNGEDLTDGDYNVAEQEELHFSAQCQLIACSR